MARGNKSLCTAFWSRWTSHTYMSLVVRKMVFGASDVVQHKPGCTTKEDRYRLEILDLGNRGVIFLFMKRKQKVFTCCALTAQLIHGFVFAYAKAGFLIRRLIW